MAADEPLITPFRSMAVTSLYSHPISSATADPPISGGDGADFRGADGSVRAASDAPTIASSGAKDPSIPQPRPLTEQSWPAGTRPVVSICCITYNHARFIRECLDGFLMQETSFPVEVVIHDDASADGTADIIREYERRYPRLINPIYQEENQYSKGISPIVNHVLPRATGKYIALCEGDDYWAAPDKLQTQVDFMESHPTYSACFHNASVRYEGDPEKSHVLIRDPPKSTYTVRDLATGNVVPTLSVLFRSNLFVFPDWYKRMPIGDWPLHVLNAEHGPFRYIDRVLAVYRVHGSGLWSSLRRSKTYEVNIAVAQAIDAHLHFRFTDDIKESIACWHYQAAQSLEEEGATSGIVAHLLKALHPRSKRVPRSDLYRRLFKHALPGLYSRFYWRWQRIEQRLRGRA